MDTVAASRSVPVTLPDGHVLTVMAPDGCAGRVWQPPGAPVDVAAGETKQFGPFKMVTQYTVEAVTGSVLFKTGAQEFQAPPAPQPKRNPAMPGPIKLPNMARVAGAIDQLHHGLEARAGKLVDRVEGLAQRGAAVFDRAHKHLDNVAEAAIADVQGYVDQVEKALGGNGGPLDNSGK